MGPPSEKRWTSSTTTPCGRSRRRSGSAENSWGSGSPASRRSSVQGRPTPSTSWASRCSTPARSEFIPRARRSLASARSPRGRVTRRRMRKSWPRNSGSPPRTFLSRKETPTPHHTDSAHTRVGAPRSPGRPPRSRRGRYGPSRRRSPATSSKGGLTMGLAPALLEEIHYDENGNILGGSFMDYLLPTAVETPKWETAKTTTPSPHHPIGAKGVGESATVGAPAAIVNAVVDALAHLGVTHIDIPITPWKVWKILHEKRAA